MALAPGAQTPAAALSSTKATLLLLAIAALALGLRAQGFEWVFVDEETVVFPPGDAQYHVRRSLQAWVDFPRVMVWDSYINYPDGAAISWPPLFDMTVAALARIGVRDAASFDRFVAWLPPFFGALAIIPVYLTGRELYSRAVGVGAALLLALFPLSVSYSRVGQLDHHCAVALVGAWLLFVNVALVSRDDARSRRVLAAGLLLARIAMLLTWHGSLLYIGLADATLWLVAGVTGRRDLYAAQAGSALGTAVVLAPLVALLPEPLGGAYSAIALSQLHVMAVGAVALVSLGLWWLTRPLPDGPLHSPRRRLLATFLLGISVVLVWLSLPGPREGLEPALRFLTMTDGVGARTGEQLPLFPLFGRPSGRPVTEVWGAVAWFIPLMPIGVVLGVRRASRDAMERRHASWVVASFCLVLGVLAIVQRRYGNDLAPSLAVATAVTLAALSRAAIDAAKLPRRGQSVLACLIGFALLAPPILGAYRARAASALRALEGGYVGRDLALETVAGSLTRFLEQVRRVTPETSGFASRVEVPEYAVVADPNLGHAIQNIAHRPTPTDPFWAFIGQENWDRAAALLGAKSEALALEFSESLNARYVVTLPSASPATLEGWLHAHDGLAANGWRRGEHLRLVTEGPRGGLPLSASFQVQGPPAEIGGKTVPYKLFEIVNGARLEVEGEPGVEVHVVLALTTPTQRKIRWRAVERADPLGVATFQLLYPTGARADDDRVSAPGLYHVTMETAAGTRSGSLAVSERQIVAGEPLSLSLSE